jgi:hypothetical protein
MSIALVYTGRFHGAVGCRAAVNCPLVPYFIFRVWREDGRLERLLTIETPHLSEADSYRRAEARLRELRRSTTPNDGYYVHLAYGEDEAAAQAKLLEQLGLP